MRCGGDWVGRRREGSREDGGMRGVVGDGWLSGADVGAFTIKVMRTV